MTPKEAVKNRPLTTAYIILVTTLVLVLQVLDFLDVWPK